MKKRIILFVFFMASIATIYLLIEYNKYKKQKAYITEIYQDFPFSYAGIYRKIIDRYNITQSLPDKKKIDNLLKIIDSNLFAKGNYKLEVDTTTNYILLYSFYPANKDVQLKNYLDMIQFLDRNEKELDKFNFINYLKNDYNILFLNRKINYKLGKSESDYLFKCHMSSEQKKKLKKDYNFRKKFNLILKKFDLESFDFSDFPNLPNAAIYIYDKKKIKKIFPDDKKILSEETKNKLFELLKKTFPECDYIRFSIMIPDSLQQGK